MSSQKIWENYILLSLQSIFYGAAPGVKFVEKDPINV